jgi:uncharacterized integral membrane protein
MIETLYRYRETTVLRAKLIGLLVLMLLALIFLLQNTAVVEIRFLFWSLPMSRALFMLLFLVIGVASGWLLHSYVHLRRSR